jgi:hypothetical protein
LRRLSFRRFHPFDYVGIDSLTATERHVRSYRRSVNTG